MPNYCQNSLFVQGDKKRIDEFVKFAKGKNGSKDEPQHIDFNKFIPFPKEEIRKEELKFLKYRMKECKTDEELERVKKSDKITNEVLKEIMLMSLEEEDSEMDILGWHTRHWGTKWNAVFYESETAVTRHGDGVKYFFDTAWGPSLPVTLEMSKKFKDLIFTHLYAEFGMDFSGYIRVENGKMLEDSHTKLKKNWECPKKEMKKWGLDKIYNGETP
jgi:hypothetical protein